MTFQIIILAVPTSTPSGHVWIPIRAHYKGLNLFGHPISHLVKFRPKLFGLSSGLATYNRGSYYIFTLKINVH